MRIGQEKRFFALLKAFNELASSPMGHVDVCLDIILMCDFSEISHGGKSNYARRRRAKSLDRCARCFRILPSRGGLSTKCDQKNCRAGISGNLKRIEYIRWGRSKADA
ncbi:MAG: nucleic acid binding protein [Beijing sediment betaflexivirus]|nr:MAG: nucleic acid binding protein [Beijing sediment betaflexivirus]